METEMQQTYKLDFTGTLFSNCMAKQGTPILIIKWLEDIKNGADKAEVEEIRRLFENGNTEEASKRKKLLRAIVPTGYMPEGRCNDSTIQLNGIGMADIDIHNPEWSLEAMKKLEGYPGIIGMYRTIRGGLRIFYLMPSTTTEDFKFVESVILEEIDFLLDCKHDEQATTISHLSSSSYDPETWIVSEDAIQEFPFEQALSRIQKDVYREINGEMPLYKSSDKEPDIERELEENYDQLTGKIHKSYSKTQLDNHLSRFIGRCPLEEGSRNRNLLRLGQYAHFMRYNTEELDYLIKTATYLIGNKEYNTARVRQCVCWGYRHNDKQIDFSAIAKQDFLGETPVSDDSSAQSAQSAHNELSDGIEAFQQTDFEKHFRKTVKESCPYIPTTVYDHLPPFFGPLISKSPNRRDKDLSLIAAFVTAGAALPMVTVQCRDENYSTNLFFLCIGPAASGKSAATKAPLLLDEIQAEMDADNEKRQEAYEKQEVLWQIEIKKAMKENRQPDWNLRPQGEPSKKKIVTDTQTSRSKLVTDLANNTDGLFMFTTELNTLNESLHSDSGHHSAELAKIAMNEPIGISYKADKRDIICKKPKLSILCTGTPTQYVKFIGNTHEGMESRAFTMLTTSTDDWMSWGDANEQNLPSINKEFSEKAKYLKRVYHYLQESPTHVTIPQEQRYICDKYCSLFFRRLKEEGYSSLDSIVKRAPIMIARICGILCALRKYDMGLNCTEMDASPEEVEIALKLIMTLMQHTCISSTMLLNSGKQVNKPQSIFKRENIYAKLPKEFTISDLAKECYENFNLSLATVKRMVKFWGDNGYIIRCRRGTYSKTDKLIIDI